MLKYLVATGTLKIIDNTGKLVSVQPVLSQEIIAATRVDAILCMNTAFENDPDCILLEVVHEVTNNAVFHCN